MTPLGQTELIAILTFFSTMVTSVLAYLGKRHARNAATSSEAVNDSVNHSHVSGTPRLYDLALGNKLATDELVEWRRSYNSTPWASGDKVAIWIDAHDAQFRRLEDQIKNLKSACHIDCERKM